MSIFDQFPKPPCAQTLGWELLKAEEINGAVGVAFEASPAFFNPGGNIQGGSVAAMLDDTLGPTVLVKTGSTHYCATLDLNFSFLVPAKTGRLLGIGWIVPFGKTIAFLEGEPQDAVGTVLARATVSARVLPTTGLERR